HRGAELTGDVSADLGALAARPVVTVCAGAKVFLDLPRTLEHLEMIGVPVLGWRTDELPGFTTPTSGLPVPHRVEDADDVVRIVRAGRALGLTTGVLVAVPVPDDAGVPPEEIDRALTDALAAAEEAGLRGAEVTPY